MCPCIIHNSIIHGRIKTSSLCPVGGLGRGVVGGPSATGGHGARADPGTGSTGSLRRGGEARPLGAHFPRASTNGDGIALFGRLDPSRTYGTQVFPPEERAEPGFHYVPDWKPADSTIRLDEASLVRGVVRYRPG